MANIPNNPAARLLAIVNDAGGRPIEHSNRDVWSGVFGIPPQDTTTLFRRLATLTELPAEAAAAIAALPNEPEDERYLWKPPIEEMLQRVMASINGQWRDPASLLTPVPMSNLRYWAKKLEIVRPEPVLDEDEVREVHRLVRELIERVLNSPLEIEVKEFLLDQLRAADAALQEYRIRGVAGVVAVLKEMAGGLWTDPPVARKAAETEEGRSVMTVLGRFARMFADVARVVDVVARLYGHQLELPAPPIQHLLAAPGVVDVQCTEAEVVSSAADAPHPGDTGNDDRR
jgi:hypothetical protein